MRILVSLTRDQIGALARLSEKRGCPRTTLIRAAVAGYSEKQPEYLDESFGLWRTSADKLEDGAAYQRRLRGEWK